ncbi:MAG TPA: amidohydrolase family protein [Thermoanaerobaculia bacterium]|nr:amidohydrolase family protein [Thermoanaerobaculia bacterium]
MNTPPHPPCTQPRRTTVSSRAVRPATASLLALALAAGAAIATIAATGVPPPSSPPDLPRASGVVAITGATVHTMGPAGTLQNATVLIAGGRIQEVGRDLAVPVGALRIDASGKVVTPGLCDSLTRLGLVEVDAVEDTEDSTNQDERLSAAFDVSAAVNRRSMLIPINRVEGITRAVVAPSPAKSLFLGQGAVIQLDGGPDTVVRPSVALFATLGETGARLAGGSRGAALTRLREALLDALDYGANRAAYERAQHRPFALSRLDLEALLPVARGEKPLVVFAAGATDIEAALKLARELRLRLILADAAEGWEVASEIAAAKVPVLIKPQSNLPGSFERLGATLENAARLYKAGVTIAFMSAFDAHNSRNLKQDAGNAVTYGLPWDAALAAMTVNPAHIWGIADRYGTLEPGKEADVVIWPADPLEVTTFAERVFIRGVEMPAETRQTKLRDRYLQRGGGAPPG